MIKSQNRSCLILFSIKNLVKKDEFYCTPFEQRDQFFLSREKSIFSAVQLTTFETAWEKSNFIYRCSIGQWGEMSNIIYRCSIGQWGEMSNIIYRCSIGQ